MLFQKEFLMKTPLDPTVAELVQLLDDDCAEMFQERAAIRTWDGGLSVELAEALALLDVLNRYPEALSGVTVFAIELDGTTHWIVTTDRDYAHSIDFQTEPKPKARPDLASVVRKSFGGKALLSAIEPGIHV